MKPSLRCLVPIIAMSLMGAVAAQSDAVAKPEPPLALDPVEVNAERRTEVAFRAVQVALERSRSDRSEDADLIVCLKQAPTGSNIPAINCATNRFWNKVRARSLSGGLGSVEGVGSPAMNFGRTAMGNTGGANLPRTGVNSVGVAGSNGATKAEDDKVVTLSLSDYNRLKERYGELPAELRLRR